MTPSAIAEKDIDGNYLLSIPPGPKGKYRWAQMDDYLEKPRKKFVWRKPTSLCLEARCDNSEHSGTWGFGFWNDPFNTNLGVKGSVRRLPVLPNCAWYFYASPQNYLSFENKLPTQGFLAATYSSPLIPSVLFAPTIPFLPLLLSKKIAKSARWLLRFLIKQDACSINVDVKDWHIYQINWQPHEVVFKIDQQIVLTTKKSPKGKLGIVIWVDNQYAAFHPDGLISFGTLPSQESTTLEIRNLSIQ